MRRLAAAVFIFALACRTGQNRAPAAVEPTLEPAAAPLQEPPDPASFGPYAYDPSWSVPPAQYTIVSEVEFGAAHKLESCAREFAPSLIAHPDTRMFAGEFTARNEYGDAFHAHLVVGDRDELLLPDSGVVKVKAREGTLVLVTSPLTVESPDARALVPAHTLAIRIMDQDPAILAAQPFVTVVRPKEGVDDAFITALPHNEGEAIFGIYEPSKSHVATAAWAHKDSVLMPRFVVEADGWQRVGTYPFPPDLPADAAGTQFVSLELKEGAAPVSIGFPGRPVISAPEKPVLTRADVFVSFYGLPGVKTHFVSGYGFAKEATPVMKVEAREVTEGVKNLATSIDLAGDGEEPRTVFYIHRVAAEWKEKGGRAAFAFGQEKPAVFEKASAKRPQVRSSASAFLRQIRFRGLSPKAAPSGGGALAVIPGSIAYDAARGLAGGWDAGDLAGLVGPAVAPRGGDTTAQSVTNVYINVSHDNCGPIGSGGPTVKPPYSGGGMAVPREKWELVGSGRPGGPGMVTAGSAPREQAQGGWSDPRQVYTRDPATGQLTSQLTPYGQALAASAQQQSMSGRGGVHNGYDPVQERNVYGPQYKFVKRMQQGW